MASDKETRAGESRDGSEGENSPVESPQQNASDAAGQGETEAGMLRADQAPEAGESGEVLSAADESREESRFRKGARRFFRGLALVVIIFGLGMLFMYYTFQRPRIQTLDGQVRTLQAENQDLADQVETLQGQVEALDALEGENQALSESLADSQIHVQLLAVLADVRAAQYSLSSDDGALARSQLSGVPDGLEMLGSLLPADRQGELDSMRNRANLAIEEIESDAFAAQSDLEVLANSLIQLENSLFVTP